MILTSRCRRTNPLWRRQLLQALFLKSPQKLLCKFLESFYVTLTNKNSGGGAFGYSAGAKASYKNEEKSANSTTSRKDENHMTITYNVSCPGEALYETDLLI